MLRGLGHIVTVMRHRRMVIIHCAKCGILRQGIFHDLSKYSLTELIPGIKYYQGNRSPNEAERKDKGYSEAWMHHKGRNKHHFEYWTDYDPVKRVLVPIKMPINYVKEMFCDRVAATKVYQKENYTESAPLDYFLGGRAKTSMHPDTAVLLEKLLVMLKEKGEKETFLYLKTLKDY